MKRLTSEQFESYTQFGDHFYVFFSSDTCRHCRTIAPILEKAFANVKTPLYNINNENPFLNEELGIEYEFTPHTMRRIFASRSFEQDKNYFMVRELLGHSLRPDTTEIYIHPILI
jgi:integrase